jgi:alpha/beta hydrolase family protein
VVRILAFLFSGHVVVLIYSELEVFDPERVGNSNDMSRQTVVKTVLVDTLEIGYEESGAANSNPVILLHGFPDDARAWDGVVGPLVAEGFRTIVPYLRGFGPTRFLNADTMRSGQQAALAHDLKGLIDILHLQQPILVATTGVHERLALQRLCGRRKLEGSSRSAAITSKALHSIESPRRLSGNTKAGTSGIFKPNGVEPVFSETGVISVVCYGSFGVRTGSLLMRLLMKRPAASIIRTLSTLLSILIDIATVPLSVIQIWKRLKSSFLLGQQSVYRQLYCMAKATRFIRLKCPRRRKNSFVRIYERRVTPLAGHLFPRSNDSRP